MALIATEKSVQGGERANLDVLDAQQRLVGTKRDLIEAQHRWLMTWVNIHFQAGLLSEVDIERLSQIFAPRI
ncbi:TolC family protein [Neptunomonas phycophila]|uniref:TolC family protein n=1 Tax=Neptunomonas phycophila TaxID=1572645 RepID=UPI0009491A9D|nr:TolC family protein [Neptunomonas phycophila]